MKPKALAKKLLSGLPFTVELDWYLRQRHKGLKSRFNLSLLDKRLREIVAEVLPHIDGAPRGKKIFLFASWHYWIVHTTLCGLVLRSMDHDASLGFLPYGDYNLPVSRFDLRRQDLYARNILKRVGSLLKIAPFLDVEPANQIPEALVTAVEGVTLFDAQYTLQREDVKGNEPIYLLRRERNLDAARRAYTYLQNDRPDIVVVPNGMIQEYGVIYATARLLDIPVVTYEFGEQDRRIWLEQNKQVMFHDTERAWKKCRGRLLNQEQRAWLETFLKARQGFELGDAFAHLYQKVSRFGSESIRSTLGLDDRPVVLFPTNVLGDSATLGRTVFSQSMAEWIERLMPYIAAHPQVQWVIRIHPSETWTVGPSVAEIIRKAMPEIPSHVRLIEPAEKINTYDLMDIADLALVYTTTAGLEMALRGVPVLVSGRAAYRRKGFTLDADTWEEYFGLLDAVLGNLPAHRLTADQLEAAWNYAYFFFREYPHPFPWHVEKIRKDLRRVSMAYVLSQAGQSEYGQTFQYLAGEPLDPVEKP
jgi:Capsule polysaccharide biosynthesis protein